MSLFYLIIDIQSIKVFNLEMEFINKFKYRTDVEKAKVYYWIYGVLYSIIFIICQKFSLIIKTLLNGTFFLALGVFLLFQVMFSIFRSCEVSDLDEIENDIKNLIKSIFLILFLHLVFNLSLKIPDFKNLKKYWEEGVIFFPGFMLLILSDSICFGGMGAISRYIARQKSNT